jgi:hypothetical protein
MLAFLTTLVSFTALGQSAQFKALFLYNFAQNISYPENSMKEGFVITVIGEPEVAKELLSLAKSRQVGSYPLKIKESNSVETVENSQIIYLAEGRSNQMSLLEASQKSKPVLLVGNQKGLYTQGADISFIMVDGKLRFEICQTNIENQGIKCSSKLTALGLNVK